MSIHPTALVESGAEVAADASIGPYCLVGPEARIGAGVELIGHVVVAGRTEIGPRTRVWPFASLGHPPQDLKYRGEATRLEIGPDCTIREHVTVNLGTAAGGGVTRVGTGCVLMAGVHIAHDCRLGERVVVASGTMLGGHVTVGDFALIGGLSGVQQFVRIGAHAYVGGMTGVDADVPPYTVAHGNRARLAGINVIGLRRRGVPSDAIAALRGAYRMIFAGDGPLAERVERAARAWPEVAEVQALVAFIRTREGRPLCPPDDR